MEPEAWVGKDTRSYEVLLQIEALRAEVSCCLAEPHSNEGRQLTCTTVSVARGTPPLLCHLTHSCETEATPSPSAELHRMGALCARTVL